MKKTSLTALTLALLLLAGCSSNASGSIASLEITKSAVAKLDTTICTALKNQSDADKCISDVQDVMSYESAIANASEKSCQEIKNSEMKDGCLLAIKSTVDEKNKMKDEEDRLSVLEQAGDKAKCKELAFEGFRRQCEINIDLAKQSKEASTNAPLSNNNPKPPQD